MQRQLLVLAVLILAIAMLMRATENAPDPRAACEQRLTQAERDQCRHMIDFALSAGW